MGEGEAAIGIENLKVNIREVGRKKERGGARVVLQQQELKIKKTCYEKKESLIELE